jgi:hypothetical protein
MHWQSSLSGGTLQRDKNANARSAVVAGSRWRCYFIASRKSPRNWATYSSTVLAQDHSYSDFLGSPLAS